ncbi:MarR family winged helix-turn-helix transcriptional regulator [Streptomyces mirabilis]|uniref:MarR family winged helix-turn-helix transcriptional regulator n=1 Tax=Streptomyces mirabilis TaxID=68239 RepID=UPI0036C909D3
MRNEIEPRNKGVGDTSSAAHYGSVSSALFRVTRMHRMLIGQLLREVGLHPGQELVMIGLWERGRMRQVDLARLVGSDAPTMTRTVQRLEQAGLVRRVPSPTGKRSVIVEPTAVSLALRRRVEGILVELEQLLVGSLTDAARTKALTVLEQLKRNLAHQVCGRRAGPCAEGLARLTDGQSVGIARSPTGVCPQPPAWLRPYGMLSLPGLQGGPAEAW